MRRIEHLPEDRRMMAAMIKAMDDGVELMTATLRGLESSNQGARHPDVVAEMRTRLLEWAQSGGGGARARR